MNAPANPQLTGCVNGSSADPRPRYGLCMVFIRKKPSAASAWWLVPVGLVVFVVGLLLIPVAGGYQESRWEFLFLVGGPLLVLAGVVGGVRGKRIRK